MPRPRSSRTRSRARPRSGRRPGEGGPPAAPGLTVVSLLDEGTTRLQDAGVGTARLDAELLLRHILGWDRAALMARGTESVSPGAAELFRAAIGQRAERRPLQHLTGVQAFWRHEFLVTPDVLIPRPETELLVETALELLKGVSRPLIVDVGTGSGCIALSLAAERPDAEVHATDFSEAALRVARGNAARLRLRDRVRFHEGDLLDPVRRLAGRVDLVASNPPYISEEEWADLTPEVRDHDPRLALVPPGEPLELYRRLAGQSASLLRPGGHVLVEVGRGRAEEVMAVFGEPAFEAPSSRTDLAGIQRLVRAVRRRIGPA